MRIKTAMLFIFLVLALSAAFALGAEQNSSYAIEKKSGAASAEKKYFEMRDGFIRQFENAAVPFDDDDRKALGELEKQLREIIGPVKIEGFPEEGEISLETLQHNSGGFGQADGLKFRSGNDTLFVTTKNLLRDYLKRYNELPENFSELSKSNEFYSRVFDWDAAVTRYFDLPVKSSGDSFAYAFLGAVAQDMGPIVPRDVFVFVAKGNRVLLASSTFVKDEIKQIQRCEDKWDKFEKKSSKAFAVYTASQLEDTRALDQSERYREEGFKAYRDCFAQQAGKEKFYDLVTKKAQSIIDRLQKD